MDESEAGRASRTLADAYRDAGVARFTDTGVNRFKGLGVMPAFHDQIATMVGQLSGSYDIKSLTGALGGVSNATEAVAKSQKLIGNAIKFTDINSAAAKLANIRPPSMPKYADVLGPSVKAAALELPAIPVRHDPTPGLLRELNAEIAKANAAETVRANAEAERADKAERWLKISLWLNVGMFLAAMLTPLITALSF